MPRDLEELFDRYRNRGDIAALGEVFDRTAPTLVRVALHLCGNRQDAEDAVQATYLRAIEVAESWDAARPLTPWLVGILGNRARQRRALGARRPDPERVARPEAMSDPVAQALRRELGDAVEATIAGLPARYQPVLRLHLLDGRDPAEIAAVLARRPATVRSQLARGLRALRRLLPRGLAVGVAAAPLLSALSGMRVTVLARAGAPPLANAGAGALPIGGLALPKLTVVAVLAALLLLWLVWDGTVPWPVPSGAEPPALAGAGATATGTGEPVQRVAVAAAPDAGDMEVATARDDAPLAATGSMRVRVTWQHAREPAASVAVFVEPRRGQRALVAPWQSTTDAGGLARFVGLPPGRVHLRSGRSAYEHLAGNFADIAAGAEVQAELVLGGVTVQGVVVDARDRPVAGASILVEADGSRELARSDAAGGFVLRGIGPEARIGARAAGHAPSLLQTIKANEGGVVPLRLALPGAGGCLRCTVVDPSGAPRPGALLCVGAEARLAPGGSEAGWEWCATTDGAGRAEFDGVPTGAVVVVASAPGTAPWRGTAVVEGIAASELRIELAPGAVLEGQVRDQLGRSLVGYRVAVNLHASAPYRQFDPFAYQYADTDLAGAYRIVGLPAGEIAAEASGGGTTATQVLRAVAGETLRWDPQLAVAGDVPGRVVGPDGRSVEAIVEGGSRHRPGWTVYESAAPGGRFTLKNVTGGEIVRLEARVDFFPVARFQGALPREGELVLQVAAEDLPSVRIAGAVVDDADRPVPLAQVSVIRRGYGGSPVFTTGDGGRFDVGQFPSGEYKLHVRAAGRAELVTDWRTIAPGQALDAGALRLQPGCSVDVRLTSTGPLPGRSYFLVLDQHGGARDLEVREGRGVLHHLAPGPHELLVLDHRLALARHGFHVTAGATARLEIAVEPGVPVTIHLRGNGRALPKLVTLEVTTADGRTLLTTLVSVHQTGGVAWRNFALQAGAYRVRIALEGRPLGEQVFTVTPTATACRVEVPVAGG